MDEAIWEHQGRTRAHAWPIRAFHESARRAYLLDVRARVRAQHRVKRRLRVGHVDVVVAAERGSMQSAAPVGYG
jgi:hypothetical protein